MVEIKLENVSLKLPVNQGHSKSLRSYAGRLLTNSQKVICQQEERRILENITLDLGEGERLGLIGRNGSGKTSLLRLMAGIYQPTDGKIQRIGAIAPMFDLNFGMDEEASGYDNITMAGTMLGVARKDIKNIKRDVEEFCELGNALNHPIKIYSSGMRVRLAFGILTTINAQILLIDEIIGVGDAYFMKKAKEKISKQIESSNILVLASHADSVLQDFCTTGLILSHGTMSFYGPIDEALYVYHNQ